MRGKVKNTGEIHLSVQTEGGGTNDSATAAAAANGRDGVEDGDGSAGASESGLQAAAAIVGGKG